MTWQRGEVVLERRFHSGRLRWVLPLRVVESGPEPHLLHLATGTPFMRAVDPNGREHRGEGDGWELGPRVWTDTRVLVLLRPGRATRSGSCEPPRTTASSAGT